MTRPRAAALVSQEVSRGSLGLLLLGRGRRRAEAATDDDDPMAWRRGRGYLSRSAALTSVACAAASLATGTRNGEHDT